MGTEQLSVVLDVFCVLSSVEMGPRVPQYSIILLFSSSSIFSQSLRMHDKKTRRGRETLSGVVGREEEREEGETLSGDVGREGEREGERVCVCVRERERVGDRE